MAMVMSWKSGWAVFITSSAIVLGTDLFKMAANALFNNFTDYLLALRTPATLLVATISLLVFWKINVSGHSKWDLSGREHAGISLALSSMIFLVRGFYLSFIDFERSLSCIYTAFFFVVSAIVVIFGKNRAPSSLVVLTSSYLSLLFAFFGLTLMLAPNMENPAFVVSFTATFTLVISVVLFLIHALRSEDAITGVPFATVKKMTSVEIVMHLESFEEAEEEVFVEENTQSCQRVENVSPERAKVEHYAERNKVTPKKSYDAIEDLLNHLEQSLNGSYSL